MSIIDKVSGKAKQAVGEVTKDPSLREEGEKEELKGEVKEDLHETEEKADRQAEEVANLERQT